MLVWLDGRTNTENAAAGELRPRGAWSSSRGASATTSSPDVYAAARVFTGWNLGTCLARWAETIRRRTTSSSTTPAQHDTTAKTFTFPINRTVPTTIPARAGGGGHAGRHRSADVAGDHPATGAPPRAASCGTSSSARLDPPAPAFVDGVASIYLQSDTQHARRCMRYILQSQWFTNPGNFNARYCVAGGVRRADDQGDGLDGFSVDTARTPLTNMGQTLFEPPNVAGWQLGERGSRTGAMLARMNFAAAARRRTRNSTWRDRSAPPTRPSPSRVLNAMLQRFTRRAVSIQRDERIARVPEHRRRVDRLRRADECEGARPGAGSSPGPANISSV